RGVLVETREQPLEAGPESSLWTGCPGPEQRRDVHHGRIRRERMSFPNSYHLGVGHYHRRRVNIIHTCILIRIWRHSLEVEQARTRPPSCHRQPPSHWRPPGAEL